MLQWTNEFCTNEAPDATSWRHVGTNLALDFHGDPRAAELTVFSDGNHHMALLDAICAFREQTGVQRVFYTTTPPGPLAAALRSGGLRLGNLLLSNRPDVFISPDFILRPLQDEGRLGPDRRLFTSRGNVLLIPAGNPKGIHGVVDLAREDVRLFLSNPKTEKASYAGYRATLDHLAEQAGVDLSGVREGDDRRIVYGERIHHREAPAAVAAGEADCAVVYHHLGLRYTRIFPELFEIQVLAPVESAQSGSQIAAVGDGGRWGNAFIEFMASDAVAEVYRHHGMDA